MESREKLGKVGKNWAKSGKIKIYPIFPELAQKIYEIGMAYLIHQVRLKIPISILC